MQLLYVIKYHGLITALFKSCVFWSNMSTDDIFSSPEHEVLMVSYCDQSLSVVRALSTICFKQLLLQNG